MGEQEVGDVSEAGKAEIEPGGQVVVTLERNDQNASCAELREAVDELKAEIRALRG